MTAPIVLVGCGKMGQALLAGWRASAGTVDRVIVVEPDPPTATDIGAHYAVDVVAGIDALPQDLEPKAVVFAVKPQTLGIVANAYGRFAGDTCVFLSIAAGRTIAGLAASLPPGAAIVRAMPNTPAAVGRGATVACASPTTSAPQRAFCQRLLEAVGMVAWVEDEGLLDAVTALSGSGPAYVFHLAECLAAAGTAAGLPRGLADALARQTIIGAGELLLRSPEPAADLRRNVTSPGGTTAAALAVLTGGEDGSESFATLINAAVEAATRRARELDG